MTAHPLLTATIAALEVPAVVGHEHPFVEHLARELTGLGRRTVRAPGLLAAPGGPRTVSAHVDRHGLLTLGDGRLGYAANASAHRPLSPRTAATICRRFDRETVYAYDPETGTRLAEGTVAHADHCGIGEGLHLRARGLDTIRPGVPVAFAVPDDHQDDGWVRAQLDNALGVVLGLSLVAEGFDGTVLFTLGEEAGRSWTALRDWFSGPVADLLVLDTSPFDGPEPAEAGRVVLRNADAGADFDPETTAHLAAAARAVGVEVAWKDRLLAAAGRPLGRTELGRLVAGTGGRVTGTTLQVPTTDYHSNREATTATAAGNAFAVLREVLEFP